MVLQGIDKCESKLERGFEDRHLGNTTLSADLRVLNFGFFCDLLLKLITNHLLFNNKSESFRLFSVRLIINFLFFGFSLVGFVNLI